MSGFSTARRNMVDGQVRTNDVTDRRILDAMLEIPREEFVSEQQRSLAYLDRDLDVGGTPGRYLLTPRLTAKLLQAAAIEATDSVLVVGCASGYIAALAGRLAGAVIATESDPGLADRARATLNRLGAANLTVRAAPAASGAPETGPYDVILLNGASEVPPDALFGQLREEGRLVGVFAKARPATAMIVTRTHGDFGHRVLFDAVAPVLPGLERPPAFVF